jgi:2-amino-4-hydroxy-6-hydroxymethyldihydropteridine diphosphokinase
MSEAFLLTGSNLGNSQELLMKARNHIAMQAGTVEKVSGIYRSSPWGFKDQPAFYNQVLKINTHLDPYQLLTCILKIEESMGRKRMGKWEARTIDIDILYYENQIISGNLNIPHPLLQERRFTLLPLAEIAPGYIHPSLKKTTLELLEECVDIGIVEPVITTEPTNE